MEKINGVKEFFLRNNIVIIYNKLYKLIPLLFIDSSIEYSYIFGNEKTIVLTDDLNRPIILKDNKLSKKLFDKFRVSSIIENYLFYYIKDNNRKYGVYDLTKDIKIFETEISIDDNLLNNLILSNINKLIITNKIETGLQLWQFDLSTLPSFVEYNEFFENKVEQFLGAYDNKIWIQLNGYRLLVLDEKTGEKIHFIEKLGLYTNLFLDPYKEKIIVLAGHFYKEFDLKTLQITKSVEFDNKFSISKSRYSENDNYIYFTALFDSLRKSNCYGIFDIEKCKIVWYQLSEADEQYYDPPQANEKHIAILDDQHVLRIFERDELNLL